MPVVAEDGEGVVVVVYGTLHYSDFFGVDHWTKFRNYMYPLNPPPGTDVSAASCSKYADVDQN